MKDEKLATPCGLFCATCEYLEKSCQGCGYVEGKPFWTTQFNIAVCPIYDCCVNKKNLEHCGWCDALPCQIFLELKDPAISEAEFQQSLMDRQKDLQERKKRGTRLWLLYKK